jgi:hypothetical protein
MNVLIPKDRICVDCGSNITYIRPNGRALWRKIKDGWICCGCNSKHEWQITKNNPKLSLNLNNGVSLCIPCHKELHYGRKGGIFW